MPDQPEEYVWNCVVRNSDGSRGPTRLPKATSARLAAKKSFGSDAIVVDGKVYTEMLGFVGWISPARGFV